jgi:hypothetical protein
VNAILAAAGPTSTASTVPQAPAGTSDDNGGAGAGSYGFLVIIGLIVFSIVLFVAMNRSLRKARINLGGDQLPRRRPGARPRHVIPMREDDDPPHEPN